MGFGKKKYNAYRKRSFSLSDTKRKEYAEKMEKLSDEIYELGWSLSTMKDSCYKSYDNYKVRLSNHSADNQYHDLESGELIVNIKASKLDFVDIIKNKLETILAEVDKLDLSDFRFINVTSLNGNIHCYYKGYKTKKLTISL